MVSYTDEMLYCTVGYSVEPVIQVTKIIIILKNSFCTSTSLDSISFNAEISFAYVVFKCQ